MPATAPALAPILPREPLAGYSNGNWFIKDPNDWFVVFPKARVHVDSYNYLNRGEVPAGVESNSSADPRPRNTVFLRRARVGVQGTIARHWDFQIEGEFSSVATNGQYGTVADAFVICDYLPFLKLQVGQFNSPFMLENRTSNRSIHYMERSIAVRSVGNPQNKDLGGQIFGWLPKHTAYYSFGLFNGEGVQNIRNQDNNLLIVSRAFIAPLATLAHGPRDWLGEITIGGSVWWQRNTNLGSAVSGNVNGAAQSDVPAMSTQGGFTFLPTNYSNGKDMMGNSIRSHLVPGGTTLKGAVEVSIPLFRRLGTRFELVYEREGLDQYNDYNPEKATIHREHYRGAQIEGYAMYVEAWGWILGDDRALGQAGLSTMPRVKPWETVKPPRWGLQLLAKYERVNLKISGLPQSLDSMGNTVLDPAEGNYRVNTFELGLNAWLLKHVRLTANYVLNHIDGDSVNVKKNYFFNRPEHELLFRAAVQL